MLTCIQGDTEISCGSVSNTYVPSQNDSTNCHFHFSFLSRNVSVLMINFESYEIKLYTRVSKYIIYYPALMNHIMTRSSLYFRKCTVTQPLAWSCVMTVVNRINNYNLSRYGVRFYSPFINWWSQKTVNISVSTKPNALLFWQYI